jgi:hypothetical protein
MLYRKANDIVASCAWFVRNGVQVSKMSGRSNRAGFTWREGLLFFLLPVVITFATGRDMIDRVMAGGLINPDSYMRMVRIEEMLRQDRTLDVVSRDGSGAGTLLHWSHLLDSLLWLLAAPFTLVLGQHAALHLAASLLGPISMGLLGIAVAWAAFPIAERRWLWLAPTAASLSLPIVGYGIPGVAHHHVLLVLVAVMTGGWTLRAILSHAPANAGVAVGVWAGLGIWLSPETMPFVLMAFAGLWLSWLALADPVIRSERRDIALVIRWAGSAFFVVTGCALAVDPPHSGYAAAEIDRLSVVYLVLALFVVLLSFAPALLERIRPGRRVRAVLALMLPAACLAVWAALFPDMIRGPNGLMSDEDARAFLGVISEMQPVTTVTGAMQYLLTGSVAAAMLLWLALRRQSVLIGYAASCVLIMVALGAMHVRFAAYPCAAGAVMLPVLVTFISASLAGRPELLGVGARFAVIVLFVLALRAEGLPGLASPAKADEPALPNCEVGGLGSLLAPYAGQVVLANVNDTPELLYRTRLLTVGSLYHRNVTAFLRLRAAWRSPPSDSIPDAVRQARASFVLACPAATRSALIADLPTDTLFDRLNRGEVPPWLRKIAEHKASGNVLYRVMQ